MKVKPSYECPWLSSTWKDNQSKVIIFFQKEGIDLIGEKRISALYSILDKDVKWKGIKK